MFAFGIEIARIRRLFSCCLKQVLSCRTKAHLSRQEVVLAMRLTDEMATGSPGLVGMGRLTVAKTRWQNGHGVQGSVGERGLMKPPRKV